MCTLYPCRGEGFSCEDIQYPSYALLAPHQSENKSEGHLWQGRFFSCIVDERHLYACIRYVENNPVRAGLVRRAEEYRWSSAASHVLREDDPILSDDCPMRDGVKDWTAYLDEGNSGYMAKIKELISNERVQYLVYIGISIGVAGLTGIGYSSNNLLFQRYIGGINPLTR
jgi:hypothetical protein